MITCKDVIMPFFYASNIFSIILKSNYFKTIKKIGEKYYNK